MNLFQRSGARLGRSVMAARRPVRAGRRSRKSVRRLGRKSGAGVTAFVRAGPAHGCKVNSGCGTINIVTSLGRFDNTVSLDLSVVPAKSWTGPQCLPQLRQLQLLIRLLHVQGCCRET